MKKLLSIIFLGLLCLFTARPCAGFPFDVPNELNVESIGTSKIDDILKRSVRDLASDQQRFRQEMLQAHNEYRIRHCVPALTLDSNITSGAQQYAQYLVTIDRLQHSGAPGLGENLAMRFSSAGIGNYSGRDPTNAWYNEVSQYSYNPGGFSSATGHFTQLVWKGSKKLGVGVAYNSARTKVYVVARYSPPGNYLNQFSTNVLPPQC